MLETVTIALGDTLVPVTVPIVDDAVVEEDGESFSLLVVAIEGAISLSQSTTTIGILDNDRTCGMSLAHSLAGSGQAD